MSHNKGQNIEIAWKPPVDELLARAIGSQIVPHSPNHPADSGDWWFQLERLAALARDPSSSRSTVSVRTDDLKRGLVDDNYVIVDR